MALENQSPSKHNRYVGMMSGTTVKIPHPKSTRYHDKSNNSLDAESLDALASRNHAFRTPSAKRRKLDAYDSDGRSTSPRSPIFTRSAIITPTKSASYHRKYLVEDEIPDSDDEELPDESQYRTQEARKTQLEEALAPVQTDEEAIQAYEAQRAAETPELEQSSPKEEGEQSLQERILARSWKRGRSSIYLDAFNLALGTVLEEESHLFDDAEKHVFKCFEELSYEAQYLYVRLFLRKTSAWFRVGKLGYYDDITNIVNAVDELQTERSLPKGDPPLEPFPGEPQIPLEAQPLSDTFAFAECSDDQITTLNEASSLLLLDELKVLAKDAKVGGKNKTELLHNLRRTSGKQKGLGFLRRSDTDGSVASRRSTPGPEIDDEGTTSEGDQLWDGSTTPNDDNNRDAHFTKKILEQTGKCIRLSLTPLKLFERVHLVFYRSTEWTEKSLTTLVLAQIARRSFPEYIASRSVNIFESRAILLEFESCLRLQFRVDSVMEFSGYATHQDLEDVRAIFERVYPRGIALLKSEQLKEERVYESGEGPYLRRFSPAWVYIRIMHKFLAILARDKERKREHDLICVLLDQRLFHPSRRGAWYQRKALLEEHYMYALTDKGGRGIEANKKHWKRTALNTCETGLQDRECHIRYHYDLQKRIKKLERQLKVPKREQHDFGHVGLLKAFERTIEGIQIIRNDPVPLRRKSSNPESSTASLALSRETSVKTIPSKTLMTTAATTTPPPPQRPGPSLPNSTSSDHITRRSTKTIWLDELDTNLPVGVESLTLSHYRTHLGFKGYHSEGGVLRTLFGLLFYDVLFVYVPNVFQTPYQTCPLDLHTDAFYSTRISEINSRVNELSNGDAETILRRVWNEHYERKTCIVGVRWDYDFEDILEIVRCWDGPALGTVMRVLAQEYAERGGGVPDLFLWKVEMKSDGVDHNGDNDDDDDDGKSDADSKDATIKHKLNEQSDTEKYGRVMFVEVKSENDRLSDTQRLWMSVLLNAGVEVELCHVKAREVRRI